MSRKRDCSSKKTDQPFPHEVNQVDSAESSPPSSRRRIFAAAIVMWSSCRRSSSWLKQRQPVRIQDGLECLNQQPVGRNSEGQKKDSALQAPTACSDRRAVRRIHRTATGQQKKKIDNRLYDIAPQISYHMGWIVKVLKPYS